MSSLFLIRGLQLIREDTVDGIRLIVCNHTVTVFVFPYLVNCETLYVNIVLQNHMNTNELFIYFPFQLRKQKQNLPQQ